MIGSASEAKLVYVQQTLVTDLQPFDFLYSSYVYQLYLSKWLVLCWLPIQTAVHQLKTPALRIQGPLSFCNRFIYMVINVLNDEIQQ